LGCELLLFSLGFLLAGLLIGGIEENQEGKKEGKGFRTRTESELGLVWFDGVACQDGL